MKCDFSLINIKIEKRLFYIKIEKKDFSTLK